jgi:methionyl-tRNA synthetase
VQQSSAPRHYLLVPPEPTPNGGLHLGHIAGPFLRMDVIARYLRMRGDRPALMTGTDSYEPWVAMKARTDGVGPGEVAAENHTAIRQDLAAMRIEMDEYLDPADEPWHGEFRREIEAVVARLGERGAISRVVERVPCDERTGRFVVGPLLLGRCPDCGAEVAGYGCEGCGAQLRPDQVLEPRARFAGDRLNWREIESQFTGVAGIDVLEPQFKRLEMPERYREAVRAQLRREGPRIRLSAPHDWGMPLPGAQAGSSLFSYTGGFMFARLLGELHRQRIGARLNSFDTGSDVTTVTSLGCDNVISTLVCINALAPVHGGTRPYDRCLINEFYHLAGEKFSTSRGHVIGASAISRVAGLQVDAVRYYLALVNPEATVADFVPRDFLDRVNLRLAGQLEARIGQAWARLPAKPGPIPGAAMGLLDECLEAYRGALDSTTVRLVHAVAALDRWIDAAGQVAQSANASYWWLKGLALLAYPVMCDLGAGLWTLLGAPGGPSFAAFSEATAPEDGPWQRRFTRVGSSALAPCLPEYLR